MKDECFCTNFSHKYVTLVTFFIRFFILNTLLNKNVLSKQIVI